MKKTIYLILALIIMVNSMVFADENLDNTVLAKVGSEEITYKTLNKAFKKNLNRQGLNLADVPKDSLMEFLDLYLKYRLKVNDALDRGFQDDSTVIADTKLNRKILAESFFFDEELVKPNVERLVERRKSEKKIAIIVISKDPASDSINNQKYEYAKNALAQIQNGVEFSDVAAQYSNDTHTKDKGGIIDSYITAGRITREIEEPIYSLEEGEVYPYVIETANSFFIVKLIDDAKRIKVKPSHILIKTQGEERDSLQAYKMTDSLITLLKRGASFERLAEDNSEDPSSAIKGGYLGSYYIRSTGLEQTGGPLVPEFEKALFELKDGEYSGIIKTDYGFHIIKRDSTQTVDSETERDEMEKLYKRLYFKKDKNTLLDDFAYNYGFNIKDDVFGQFVESLDTNATTLDSAWTKNIHKNLYEKQLFGVLKEKFTVKDFIEEVKTNRELKGLALNKEGIEEGIKRIVRPIVFARATQNLEKTNSEFAELMNEFRDGILLFRVEGMEVWEKLKFDTTLARQYWEPRKNQYMTNKVYDISEIFLFKDSLAKAIREQIDSGEDFEFLATEHTMRDGMREKAGRYGFLDPAKNDLAKIAHESHAKPDYIIGPVKSGKGQSIIKVNDIREPRVKTFEEAIPDFAGEYQDMLQKKLTDEWLKGVREKFPVTIYTDRIDKILEK